ncbi:MAG: hypothetical protein BWK76_12875 [Desulfobulbaceae bacterium A2]|nr:MAG: hypothetical protein BWK76_12875 [Desulfobulbaceae bacterium A2]
MPQRVEWLLVDARDALLGLRRRPLRSLLSGLGIGIGVTALVAMLSIGEGARQQALAKIASLGLGTIRIENAVREMAATDASRLNLARGLSEEDLLRIRSELGDQGLSGGAVRRDGVRVMAAGRAVVASLAAVSGDWFGAEQLRNVRGRALHADDLQRQERVCVLGSAVAAELQAREGEVLVVDNLPCVLVGVLAPRGRLLAEGTGLSTVDFDRLVLLPLGALPGGGYVGGRRMLDSIVVRLHDRNEARVTRLAERLRGMLAGNRHGADDIRLVEPVSLLREARATNRIFSLVMGSIAGLSLLVGGIGVMNVMLANIAEQTREVGLRMALGATRGRIISLYLCHSVLLGLSGAVWGFVMGLLLAWAIQRISGWQVAFSPLSLVLAPLAALMTGLIFGLHPARRAADLDPARALRES